MRYELVVSSCPKVASLTYFFWGGSLTLHIYTPSLNKQEVKKTPTLSKNKSDPFDKCVVLSYLFWFKTLIVATTMKGKVSHL